MNNIHSTHSSSARRFNRHNLPPNHAAILAVLDEEMNILAVVSAAARFTSENGASDKFDQLFVCQHADDASAPAVCQSMPVNAEAHRTTVIFNDNAFTERIGKLKPGRCWASISIRGRGPTALRPEIVWEPLDERNWKSSREMMDKFPLPALGESWPMDSQITDYAEINPQAWHLFVTAAVVIGGMPAEAFPHVAIAAPTEMNFLQQRDAKIRAERSVNRTQRMLEKLPPELREKFLAKLNANAK